MRPPFARSVLALAFACAALVSSASVQAQGARARLRDLNQDAMSSFHELDLERAEALLAQALALAEGEHIDGAELARVHLSLGIVAIGGHGNSQRGVESFMRALSADPTIELDPMTSTPEIQSAFQLARTRVASGARPTTAPSTATTPTTSTLTPGVSTAAAMTHIPPMEQTRQTALPIYVELRNGEAVARTVVMYRANGMRRFRELSLSPVGTGLGAEIPCDDVFEGDFTYYLVAYDQSDRIVASVASATDPLHVRIVRTRSARAVAPSLPGRPAPASCAHAECPPGMNCTPTPTPATEPQEIETRATEESEPAAAPESRFFLQVGGVLGAYRAASGMQTDGPPDPSVGLPASYVPAGAAGCDTDPGTYCVRVTQAGVLPVFGARLMLGYWVSSRVAIAVGARGGFGGGKSTLSYALLQFRTQFLVSSPADTRFRAAVTLGSSLGQVQVRPDQAPAGVARPYAQVGLGSVQLGAILSYRFAEHVGFYTSVDGSVFFRRFNVGADFTLGLEFDF